MTKLVSENVKELKMYDMYKTEYVAFAARLKDIKSYLDDTDKSNHTPERDLAMRKECDMITSRLTEIENFIKDLSQKQESLNKRLK